MPLVSISILLLCLVVGALITWRLLSGSERNKYFERQIAATQGSQLNSSEPRGSAVAPGYRAVSLRICSSPCVAALEQRGQTFLMDEAPRLPLQGCDRSCFCKFSTHEDRRVKDDRRYPAQEFIKVAGGAANFQSMDNHSEDKRDGEERRTRKFRYKGIY
jgi:hypothetical protein